MTLTLIILNLALSLLAMLGVGLCVLLAHRLRSQLPLETDVRAFADPLPLSLVAPAREPAAKPLPRAA